MEEKTTQEPAAEATHHYGLQEYLSLGYLFLIVLGLVESIVYYKFLNIPILDYSALSDILITPLSLLSGENIVPLLVIGALCVGYLYMLGIFYLHDKNKDKAWYQHLVKDPDKTSQKYARMKKNRSTQLLFLCWLIFCIFVGISAGRGIKHKELLREGKFEVSHSLTFSNDSTKQVRVLGQNSLYIFYVPERGKEVIIIPIGGNIKAIQVLK
jgi:hypothetical protein